jgi:glutathione S-transferase
MKERLDDASLRLCGVRQLLQARLALALLERDYERVAVDIFAGDTLTDENAAINPARETPVLELDNGTYLTQSNAILWYLAKVRGFCRGRPPGALRS